jgi:hypothetical protein
MMKEFPVAVPLIRIITPGIAEMICCLLEKERSAFRVLTGTDQRAYQWPPNPGAELDAQRRLNHFPEPIAAVGR